MEQTEITFPAPAQPRSPQLTIAECDEVIGLRYHFRVPEYGGRKGNMLAGFKHVVHVYASLADDEIMSELGWDVNRLAQEYLRSAVRRVVKQEGLPSDEFVEFRGVDFCRHLVGTKPAADDPRWV